MPKDKAVVVGGTREGSGLSSDPVIRQRQLDGLAKGREMYRDSIRITDSEEYIRPISFRTLESYTWFKALNPTQRGEVLANEDNVVREFAAGELVTIEMEFKKQSVSVRFKENQGQEFLSMNPNVRGAYVELIHQEVLSPARKKKKKVKSST